MAKSKQKSSTGFIGFSLQTLQITSFCAENGERESMILHGTKSLFNLLVYFPEYKIEDNRVLELINRKLHGNDILLSYTKKSKHSEFEVVLIQEIPLQFY